MKITRQDACRIAIAAQGLDGGWKFPAGKEGAARAIERLGMVQIDTIAVVERAHHHTIWSRRGDYQPAMLHELLAVDRRVFEYWVIPTAAYVPMSDYRWYLPFMRQARESDHYRRWMDRYAADAKRVLARIAAEGPLGSSDFPAPPGMKRGTWWDWKPAKQALEILFARGELMVSSRRNFERLYDLAERVLPADVDRREPDAAEAQRFAVNRYLAAHGLAAADEIGWANHRRVPADVLHELHAAGEIVPVQVEGLEKEYWALPGALSRSRRGAETAPTVHVLSPFDSFVHRRRLRRLFDFHYTLECYVPAPKRKYGYFCLPILCGDQFVGRLDAKADRPAKRLLIRRLMLESKLPEADALGAALARELHAFARFNGCDCVDIQASAPSRFRAVLRRALAESASPS